MVCMMVVHRWFVKGREELWFASKTRLCLTKSQPTLEPEEMFYHVGFVVGELRSRSAMAGNGVAYPLTGSMDAHTQYIRFALIEDGTG